MKRIAIIDPNSSTLPYDYFYIIEVSKYCLIDFYYSNTRYNFDYIIRLRKNKNVNLIEYNISGSISNKGIGLLNYLRMLSHISMRRSEYHKIHFIWNLYFPMEQVFFRLFRNKLVFTFHNNVPHHFKGKVFSPYAKINALAPRKVLVSKFTLDAFRASYEDIGEYYLINHGIMPVSDVAPISNDFRVPDSISFWGRVEDYKGVDIFESCLLDFPIKIYGKWNSNLSDLRLSLAHKENIELIDHYLSHEELQSLLCGENIFILPYKDATQSGVLYALLAHNKVFISSDVGENGAFLREHGLDNLIFDRDNETSIIRAFRFAQNNYKDIKCQLQSIKKSYEWDAILPRKVVADLYDF